MKYKVSVVTPIFNVENYLERYVESLMRQTLREIEYIFVDDGSTDGTFKVLTSTLSRFPERQNDIKIIRHDVNKGVSASRQEGYEASTGDFIILCDGDDRTDVTMLEKMYDKVVSDRADICFCDIYLEQENGLERVHIPLDCSKPTEEFVYDYILWSWTALWNILASRDLYQRSGAKFPIGIQLGDDFYISVCLFQYARKITSVNESLYYYNKMNVSSIVHTVNNTVLAHEGDTYARLIKWFKDIGVYEYYRYPMQWRMLKANRYLPFQNRFEELRKLHPESLKCKYILTAPSTYLKGNLPFIQWKEKIMLLLASWKLDFICRWDNRRHGR